MNCLRAVRAAIVDSAKRIQYGKDVEEVDGSVRTAGAARTRKIDVVHLASLREHAAEPIQHGEDVEEIDPLIGATTAARTGEVAVGRGRAGAAAVATVEGAAAER